MVLKFTIVEILSEVWCGCCPRQMLAVLLSISPNIDSKIQRSYERQLSRPAGNHPSGSRTFSLPMGVSCRNSPLNKTVLIIQGTSPLSWTLGRPVFFATPGISSVVNSAFFASMPCTPGQAVMRCIPSTVLRHWQCRKYTVPARLNRL